MKDQKKASEQFYGRRRWLPAISPPVRFATVLTNNSGPIFNIYLLNCGLSMNQFVARSGRPCSWLGKNVAKVGARLVAGSISVPVIIHGLQQASCAWSASSAPSPSRTGRASTAPSSLRGGCCSSTRGTTGRSSSPCASSRRRLAVYAYSSRWVVLAAGRRVVPRARSHMREHRRPPSRLRVLRRVRRRSVKATSCASACAGSALRRVRRAASSRHRHAQRSPPRRARRRAPGVPKSAARSARGPGAAACTALTTS